MVELSEQAKDEFTRDMSRPRGYSSGATGFIALSLRPEQVASLRHDERFTDYPCDGCGGEGVVAVPTAPGSETTAHRTCGRCQGLCVDPSAWSRIVKVYGRIPRKK